MFESCRTLLTTTPVTQLDCEPSHRECICDIFNGCGFNCRLIWMGSFSSNNHAQPAGLDTPGPVKMSLSLTIAITTHSAWAQAKLDKFAMLICNSFH